MERIGIILRISVTLLLLGTVKELAHSVGERVALRTAPATIQTPNLVVQARRTIMDRIAQGRLLLQSDPNHAEMILVQLFVSVMANVLHKYCHYAGKVNCQS